MRTELPPNTPLPEGTDLSTVRRTSLDDAPRTELPVNTQRWKDADLWIPICIGVTAVLLGIAVIVGLYMYFQGPFQQGMEKMFSDLLSP